MAIDISEHGPLFDGQAEEALRRYCEDLREDIAQEAVDLIHVWLHLHLKHPTGRYENSIHIDRARTDFVVTDWPIVYGPWLEGVGSRNFPVTRFRGYHAFRVAAQELKHVYVPSRSETLLHNGGYLEEMNR